ncbi:Hydrolase-4 domain-containing protein [Fusarium falciforme]|uniref:Hydrolase-4 domain-containing protein n=1 Tax=Fusarium falciforme TaxID=195108 RepID=UPI0023013AC1|nr:Hydrolase-4 domain-containing protein [Fusarium falciforme]WAO96407.1 Hydrolase-4 domain-containing protein [Fusarium falciforme]
MPYLDIEKKRLFYTQVEAESPRAGSPVLVFIHGLGSSHSFYTPVMGHLAAAGYPSVAFDVYGSGLSELMPGTEDPTFDSIAQDVESLISKLNIPIENVVAVGHSMGGIVVAKLASRNKLRGAGLIGPVLPKPAMAGIFNSRVETVMQHGMEAMANTIPLAATGSRANSTQKAFIRALLLSQKTDGYIALCNAIAKAERPSYADAHSPLLIIAGEEDKTSPVSDSEAMLESWGCDNSAKNIRILPGVGHWHCIEAADEVGSALEDFVSKLG